MGFLYKRFGDYRPEKKEQNVYHWHCKATHTNTKSMKTANKQGAYKQDGKNWKKNKKHSDWNYRNSGLTRIKKSSFYLLNFYVFS